MPAPDPDLLSDTEILDYLQHAIQDRRGTHHAYDVILGDVFFTVFEGEVFDLRATLSAKIKVQIPKAVADKLTGRK